MHVIEHMNKHISNIVIQIRKKSGKVSLDILRANMYKLKFVIVICI